MRVRTIVKSTAIVAALIGPRQTLRLAVGAAVLGLQTTWPWRQWRRWRA